MSVVGVTLAARTALAAALTTASLTCLAYDEWDGSGFLATIGAAEWDLGGPDQRRGIYAITFTVLVYQVVDGAASVSIAYQEAALEKIVDNLSDDPTLGGKVGNSETSGDARQSFYAVPGGLRYSIVEIPVRVMPFGNAA